MAVAPASLRPNLDVRFFIFFLCVFTVMNLPASSSLSETEALLNFKKSLINAETLDDTWIPNSLPCNESKPWLGLLCFKGILTGLRLEMMNLSGRIDVDSLIELKGLRIVSFLGNSFSGSIPEFNRVGFLRSVFLSGNRFSGEIPSDYFLKMRNLKKLYLNDNNFTGQIPPSLNQIPQPIELHLENNQFSGSIPIIEKPSLVSFNVSNNKLEGEIPHGLSKFNESSFSGNSGLCGEKLGKSCGNVTDNANSVPNDNGNKLSVGKIAGIVAASIIVILLLALIVMKSRRKKEERFDSLPKGNNRDESTHQEEAVEVQVAASPVKKNAPTPTPMPAPVPSPARKTSSGRKGSSRFGDLVMVNTERGCFGLSDLMKASAEVLGNGGLGSCYKAVMANGVAVVVKRMRGLKGLGKEGFDAEMSKLGRLKHWNVLTPLAYHYRTEENLVVYEYVPKGTLLFLLHGDRGPSHSDLDWPARLKIAHGIAEGLSYLHTELSSDLPHGNLKSSNILLGPRYEPLLMDYGFNIMAGSPTASQALFAYKAPEAIQSGQVSAKCDVFCLGVVILELLTGKFPSQYHSNGKGGFDVVQWIEAAITEGRETELLDPEIASAKQSISEMVRLLHVGAACTESNPEKRLDMMEAIRRIKDIKV